MTEVLNPSMYPTYAAECGDPSRTKKLGFGRRLAVLLLDVCNVYYSPTSPLVLPQSKLETVTAAMTSVLNAARSADGSSEETPIVFAQTYYTHPKLLDAGLAALKRTHADLFFARHPGELTVVPSQHPSLSPLPTDIILKKKYPSAFFGTNLATQLTALGIDTLVIMGFTTSVNVRASTLDAMQSGFRPIVVADACADLGEETHWANLMDLGAKYGDVIGVAEVCEHFKRGL